MPYPPRHLNLYMSIAAALTLIAWPTAVLLRQGWMMVAWLPVGVGLIFAYWKWSGQMASDGSDG